MVDDYKPMKGAARGPGCCDKFQAAIVEFFIFFAWVCLELTNLILHVFFGISALVKALHSALTCSFADEEPKHVVIVGASFGGLAVQRELSGLRGLKVTLVDFKDYFEYTPGALRCLVEPSWLKELTKPLPCTNNELLTAAMTGATSTCPLWLPSNCIATRVSSSVAGPITSPCCPCHTTRRSQRLVSVSPHPM